jgi:hypothetical protein
MLFLGFSSIFFIEENPKYTKSTSRYYTPIDVIFALPPRKNHLKLVKLTIIQKISMS